jgi:thiol-disulfide isomerase/thioredoxin
MEERESMSIRSNRVQVLVVLSLVSVAAIYYYWVSFSGGSKTGVTEGLKAEDFTVVGLGGESFQLSKHLGRVVVLEFMTTWCGYCEMQIGELRAFQERVEGVTIVTIEVDARLGDEAFEAWADEKGFGWLVAHSPEAGRTYKVTGVPTVIVVDKEGTIRYRGPYTQSNKLEILVLQYM